MFRFDACELDPLRRELRRDGSPVHLEPQAFDLLVHLVEQRDRVVPKAELLDAVWGHRFLSEAALTTRVKEIRKAVGDDGTAQHTIRNVRGRGYRFVAELDDAPVPAGRRPGELIGREAELAVIVGQLRVAPLVTLVGPGGVGKSTLARAAARALADTYADGVHVVELATLSAGDGVLPAIARALDVVLDGDRPERSVAAVARLDALLVADNCEHLVDDVADVVDRLVAAPGSVVRVLATSQVRLGLSAETVATVSPLGRDEAVALFVERAASTRSTWRGEPGDGFDGERVAALVDHLDRLPLTIEIAAARLGSMTFDELETAVRARGPLMQVTHRTPTARHRTLAALVDWSADLLDDHHRRALLDCSVFAGPVTADDAAAVVCPGAAAVVPATLAGLAERSLLAVELDGPVARYRMLDTVKTVARRWLDDSGGAAGAHRRHAEFVEEAVREMDAALRSPAEHVARQRLDDVVAEVRSAQRWAAEHDPALASRICGWLHLPSYGSFWGEPQTWSASLLTGADGDERQFMGATVIMAGAAANRGALDEARRRASVVLDLSDDHRLLGAALEILSDVAIYSGDFAACDGLAHRLAEVGDAAADSHLRAIATVNAALGCTFGGDPDRALGLLQRFDPAGLAPSDAAWLAYTLGEVWSASGRSTEALDSYAQAIERSRSVGNPFVTSVAQSSMATELARARAWTSALDVYADCLRDYLRHGNVVHAVTTLRNLIETLVAVGDDRGAAIVGGVVSRDDLRPSYGQEAARMPEVLAELTRRVGPDRAREWTAVGAPLDLVDGIRLAIDLIDEARG